MAAASCPLWRRVASARLAMAGLATAAGTVLCGGAAWSAAGAAAPSRQLQPPKTSIAQDQRYFADVALADPTLAAYMQQQGNPALRALLTDGSAFCALLKRGKGIDAALVAEAEGVRGTDSQTRLPLSVSTFNTIEAVALLTLCPAEQRLVPASVRAKIHRLATVLRHTPR